MEQCAALCAAAPVRPIWRCFDARGLSAEMSMKPSHFLVRAVTSLAGVACRAEATGLQVWAASTAHAGTQGPRTIVSAVARFPCKILLGPHPAYQCRRS